MLNALTSRDEGLENPREFADDWKILEIPGSAIAAEAPQVLREIVEQTSFPAITGFVMDGDCVDLYGYGKETQLWHACLVRDTMAIYFSDTHRPTFEATFLGPEEAARRAAAWSVECGLTPDRVGLVELFSRRGPDLVGETQFDDLVALLGIHPAQTSAFRPQGQVTSVEHRLDLFLDSHVAPKLISIGFVRHDRGFTFENDYADIAIIAFYPFEPGFRVHAAILHKGRNYSPYGRGRIDPVMALGRGSLAWEREWRTPGIGAVWPLPEVDDFSKLATSFTPTLKEIVTSVAGMFDRVAFIDILHGNGAGNLTRDFSQWPGPGPGALLDLEVLYESPPCFAVAEALRDATQNDHPWIPQVSQLIQFIDFRLETHSSWKKESQLVRDRLRAMLDELVWPSLEPLGFRQTATGFERESTLGDRARLDILLSAKSALSRIGFYVHAGLSILENTAWEKNWRARFNPRLTITRNPAEELFAVTREPPDEFRNANDEFLQRLNLNPWFYEAETESECGRQLATVLTDEAKRLIPLLDRTTAVKAIREETADLESLVLALLPLGQTSALEESLRLASEHPSPRVQELARWARGRLRSPERQRPGPFSTRQDEKG